MTATNVGTQALLSAKPDHWISSTQPALPTSPQTLPPPSSLPPPVAVRWNCCRTARTSMSGICGLMAATSRVFSSHDTRFDASCSSALLTLTTSPYPSSLTLTPSPTLSFSPTSTPSPPPSSLPPRPDNMPPTSLGQIPTQQYPSLSSGRRRLLRRSAFFLLHGGKSYATNVIEICTSPPTDIASCATLKKTVICPTTTKCNAYSTYV